MENDDTHASKFLSDELMGQKATDISSDDLESFVSKAKEFGFSKSELSKLRSLYSGKDGELLE